MTYRAFSLKDGKGGWCVLRLDYGRRVFYGTRQECLDWIERNGHDLDPDI